MKAHFLSTGVGRGHRFYLEGLLSAFSRRYPDIETSLSVAREVSTGPGRRLWKLIEVTYRSGSRGGAIGALYNVFRSGRRPNEVGTIGAILGRGLVDWVTREVGQEDVVIVDHPLLASILADSNIHALVYMHGELVAPAEALVNGADLILVPTEQVRQLFMASGAKSGSVVCTGLCLEPTLADQADLASLARAKRIEARHPLTGVFFSSGAEPPEHCRRIVRAVVSAIGVGGRALAFAARGGRLEEMACRLTGPIGEGSLRLNTYASISEEETLMAEVFSEVDYLVAPAHERTNWALGLGLAFFMVGPNFGSFAPLNWLLAESEAKAVGIRSRSEAADFGAALHLLRDSGELQGMNQRTITAIDGFSKGAEALRALWR